MMHVSVLFAASKSTLHIPIYASPVNLDLAKEQGTYSTLISRQINCQLMRAPNSYPIPEAADSVKYITPWKIAITLKSGLTFSNNKPVTAYDVVASYNHLENHQNYLSDISYWIKKIYAVSDTKIIVELNTSVSEFIQITALHDLPIYQKDFLIQAEKKPALWKFPVTCGGYKVIKNNDRELALAPRFGGHPIVFDKINHPLAKESEYQNFAIINDYFLGANQSIAGFRKIQVFAPRQIFLGLNLTKPYWQNKKHRCEFLAKINPDTILKLYGDSSQKANDLFPVGVIGYRDNYQFLEKIRNDYLHTNKKIKIESFHLAFLQVSIPTKYIPSYSDMVHGAVNTKNFYVEQIKRDQSNLTKFNYDAIILGFRSYALEGYDFLVLFTKNRKSFTGFNNSAISKDLLTSQDLNDSEEKARKYQHIDDIIRDECIVLPIVTIPTETFFVKESLKAPNIGKSQLEFYYLGDIL